MNKKTILTTFVCLTTLGFGFYAQNSTNKQTNLNPQLAENQPALRSPIDKQHKPKSPTGKQHTPVLISKQKISEQPVNHLWQPASTSDERRQSLPEEIFVEHIQVTPNAFDKLSEGQKVALFIPQESHEYIGTIEQSHQQFGGQVKVSSGSIENGDQLSSFTVTKGPESTLVMIATDDAIYQVEINNKTGNGTVIDDRSLDHFRKKDDSQMTPPEGIS